MIRAEQPAPPAVAAGPNQLGVAYCTHAIEAILKHIAPALGWR
jgi:hypothetical protein